MNYCSSRKLGEGGEWRGCRDNTSLVPLATEIRRSGRRFLGTQSLTGLKFLLSLLYIQSYPEPNSNH